MLSMRQSTLKLSTSIINNIQRKCSRSSKPNEVAWSSGKKERPVSWRHKPEDWYKRSSLTIKPHKLDPKDPEQQYPYKLSDGGIQYFNFVYYPRYPDEQDPVIKPSPVHFVYQIATQKFRPYWEKNIMKKLGFKHNRSGQAVVCKNTPEVNGMLWQVKHMVKILPLKFPDNIPENADPLNFFIQENGEVLYNPSRGVTESDLETVATPSVLEKDWVNEQTRKIYHNSLKLEF